MKQTTIILLLMTMLLAGCQIPSTPPTTSSAEKPVLAMYVMSQCPYGVQAENMLKPVMEKMGKDIELKIEYIGGKNGDSFSSLHGENEVNGDKIQLCAKKHSPDKYFDFILCQNENYRDIPNNWKDCAEKNKLPVDKLQACYDGDEGKQLLEASFKASDDAGATGSPTIKIEGEKYGGKRDATAIMTALCGKFKDKQPEACKDLPKPVAFEIVSLTDANCTECDPSVLEQRLKELFTTANLTRVDISSERGKELIEKYKVERIPAFIFDSKVNQTPEWQAEPSIAQAFDENYMLKDEVTGSTHFIDPEKQKAYEEALAEAKRKANEKLGLKTGDNKPQIDFFVMSYCPYGNLAEEAIKPIYDLLKTKAVFNPRYVIYTNYRGNSEQYCLEGYCSMHGIQELNQNIRELCVKKQKGMKGWFDFAIAMNKDCTAKNADTCWEDVAKNLNLSVENIKNCQKNNGLEMVKAESELNELLGVQGSPTIYIEGEEFNGGRSPAAIGQALCSKFTEKPAECDNLPAEEEEQAAPAGGCG